MKVALVTGGGTGIGRAAALELNKIDYVVYVVGRREEELNPLYDEDKMAFGRPPVYGAGYV